MCKLSLINRPPQQLVFSLVISAVRRQRPSCAVQLNGGQCGIILKSCGRPSVIPAQCPRSRGNHSEASAFAVQTVPSSSGSV